MQIAEELIAPVAKADKLIAEVTPLTYALIGTVGITATSSLACLYFQRSVADNLFLQFDPTLHVILSHIAETMLCTSIILTAMLNKPNQFKTRVAGWTLFYIALIGLYVYIHDSSAMLLTLIAACLSVGYTALINEPRASAEERDSAWVANDVNTNTLSAITMANLYELSSAALLLYNPVGIVNVFTGTQTYVSEIETVAARALALLMISKSIIEVLHAASNKRGAALSGYLQLTQAALIGYYALVEKQINVGLFLLIIFAKLALGSYLLLAEEENSGYEKPVEEEPVGEFLTFCHSAAFGTGTINPRPCTEGYYCTGATVTASPCPSGSFSNRTGLTQASECILCTPGSTCAASGLTAPDGVCGAGYYCGSGAKNGLGVSGILGGTGGICPIGNYCPAGSSAPTVCPLSTLNPSQGMQNVSQCLPCTAGYYCNSVGQSTPTGQCAQGFYCPPGQIVANPANYYCPTGFMCSVGSSAPTPCPNGYYQDQTTQSTCKICPAGFSCSGNATTPVLCPIGFYCPSGTAYPVTCQNGTYGTVGGISTQGECTQCPNGHYCNSGIISGQCQAGYICYYMNGVANPVNNLPYGDVCPIGYYCPQGTLLPVACGNGTVGYSPGEKDIIACQPCKAGYWCVANSVIPMPCPVGYYCEVQSLPKPCLNGTYNPSQFGANSTACLPCETGYYCPSQALTTYTTHPCPPGYYCPSGSILPIACPISTWSNSTKATDISSCSPCPSGYYCTLEAQTIPYECPASYYCPQGSVNATICPPGSQCPQRSGYPIICRPGYYCPLGSSAPTLCGSGTYCPLNSSTPTSCPLGYVTRKDAFLRTTVDDSCNICPPGTYGNDTYRSVCDICEPGYVCLGGTTTGRPKDLGTQGGYVCPIGYYCPAGTVVPIACSAGTFGTSAGLPSAASCTACPAGSFQSSAGKDHCVPCGSSATSISGSTTCKCTGNYRSFQETDGACICQPGYVYYDENGNSISAQDGVIDCQPIVYSRCGSGYVRNYKGECVLPGSAQQCAAACGSSSAGSVNTLGLCDCSTVTNEDQICDSTCRQSELIMQVDPLTGLLSLYDPTTSSYISKFAANSINTGSLVCKSSTSCRLRPMQVSDKGFKGVYNPTSNYVGDLLAGNGTGYSSVKSNSRRISDTAQTQIIGVSQPLVCLQLGEGIIWDISASKSHYPIYLKDSLLNTNKNFDYGDFRKLSDIMKNNLSISTFSYVFNDPGVYVFCDNADQNVMTVIRVLNATENCPSTASFKPMTSSNLVLLGITKNNTILLTPDWLLVGVLLAGFFVFIIIMIAGIHFFRTRTWRIADRIKPNYRRLLPLTVLETKGVEYSGKRLFATTGVGGFNGGVIDVNSQDIVDLEGFNVRVFYDKLKLHNENVQDELSKHQEQAMQLYDRIRAQTEAIRTMMDKRHATDGQYHNDLTARLTALIGQVGKDDANQDEVLRNIVDEIKKARQDIEKDKTNQDENMTVELANAKNPEKLKKSYRMQDALREKMTALCDKLLNTLSEIQNLSDEDSQDVQKLINDFKPRMDTLVAELKRYRLEQMEHMGERPGDGMNSDMLSVLKDFLSKTLSDLLNQKGFDRVSRYEDDDNNIDIEEEDEDFESDIKSTKSQPKEYQTTTTRIADGVISDDSDDESMSRLSPEERVQRKIRKRKARLNKKFEREIDALDSDLEQDLRRDREEMEDKYDRFMNEVLKRLEQKFSKNLNNAQDDKEKKKIMEDHSTELENLKDLFQKEKEKLEEELQSINNDKRHKKLRILQEKHQAEDAIREQEDELDRKALQDFFDQSKRDEKDLDTSVEHELERQKQLIANRLLNSRQRREKRQSQEREAMDKALNQEERIEKEILAKKKHQLDEVQKLFPDVKITDDHEQESEEEVRKRMEKKRHIKREQLENNQSRDAESELKEQEVELNSVMQKMNRDSAQFDTAAELNKAIQQAEIEKNLELMAKRKQEKKQKLALEQEKIKKACEIEEQLEKERIDRELQEKKNHELEQKKQNVDKQIQEATTEQQRNQIIDNFNQEKKEYERQMELLKQSQMDDMQRRIEEKRQKQEDRLKRKHQEELVQELKEEERVLEQSHSTKSTEPVVPTIVVVPDNLQEQDQKEIQEILKQQQQEEQLLLQEEQENERKRRQSQNNEQIKNKLLSEFEQDKQTFEQSQLASDQLQDQLLQAKIDAARRKLKHKHSVQLLETERVQRRRRNELMRSEAVEQERKAIHDKIVRDRTTQLVSDVIDQTLRPRQDREVEELNQELQHAKQRVSSIQQSEEKKQQALTDLELEYAQERVDMKRRQMEERQALQNEFSKYQELINTKNESSDKIKHELEQFQKQIEMEKQQTRNVIEEQKRRLKEQMEADLIQIEEAMNDEAQKIKDQIAKEKNKINVQELLEYKEQEVQRMLEQQKNMEKDQRDKILKQHEIDMTRFQEALSDERERQLKLMQKRIAEIQALKLKEKRQYNEEKVQGMFEAKRKHSGSQSQLNLPQNNVAEAVVKKWTNLLNKNKSVTDLPLNTIPIPSDVSQPGSANPSPRTSVTSEKEWFDRLAKSPLYAKLNKIEKLLLKQQAKTSEGNTYLDDKDAQWENEGQLSMLDAEQLSVTQFVVYKFGDFIIKLLSSRYKIPNFKLLLAKTLPKSDYAHNAYRNSFYFDRNDNTLYIRDKRLENVGEFTILLVHCLAHLTTNDFEDDNNPDYKRNFYKMMGTCCQDIFHQRTNNIEPKSLTTTEMKDKFKEDKTKFVSGILDSHVKQRTKK